MCIAVPVKVCEVLDPQRGLVIVEGAHGREQVNAGLIAEGADALAALIGRWVVVNTGFVLSVLEDEDARSRLDIFAALDGQEVADDAFRPSEADMR